MGAWIEIFSPFVLFCAPVLVAPLVGAWIEIMSFGFTFINRPVAPLVGAWIEIHLTLKQRRIPWSLPLWERGLKWIISDVPPGNPKSLPLWERGLKFTAKERRNRLMVSLPLWERGLKYC